MHALSIIFPQLRERTVFVRQAANLWAIKARMQQRLTHISGQAADETQAIDTLPLPARSHDSQLLGDLVAGFEGIVPADKRFIDVPRQKNFARKQHVNWPCLLARIWL